MTKVFACIDGSTAAPAVCDYAAWSAKRMAAPLVLLHVLSDETHPTGQNLSGNIGFGSRESLLNELAALDERRNKLALEQGRHMLEDAHEHVAGHGITDAEQRQRHGDFLDTLIGLQDETRLLVMGKRGEEGDSLGRQIGGHIESVVRSVHRPVLIATAQYVEPKRILIAFDGSPTTRTCVEMVARSPLFSGLPCHVVMIGADDAEHQTQLKWAQETLQSAGFEVHTAIEAGSVEEALCSYREAHDIDLIVMGAYGHSRIRQFLVGSTTTNVVRDATVPVLLLR
ncbi:MAG: universal stress protein [Rhodospirillales bacterium]|nr:universal stress protein [Rhodospirillales bacterium]